MNILILPKIIFIELQDFFLRVNVKTRTYPNYMFPIDFYAHADKLL